MQASFSHLAPRLAGASILTLAAMMASPAISQTAAPDISPIVSYMGADRTQKLVEGAKKEGGVTLYSSATQEDLKVQLGEFEKKYGVKVTVWRGDSEGIAQRAITERRGGKDSVDVAETSGGNLEAMFREDVLIPVTSPVQAEIIPRGIPSHRAYTANRLQVQPIGYNTNLIKKADLPKTWEDLADPKWKGKMGIDMDDGDWFGTVVTIMGEQKGMDVFRKIALNGMSMRKGHTLLANLTASGEVPVSLAIYEYKFAQMKLAGAPVDFHYLDPMVVHPVGIGIAKRAPHPNAAALFFDFILTDGQKIYLEQQTYPSNIKVKPLPAGVELHFIDFTKAIDQQDKWAKVFKETFLARPR